MSKATRGTPVEQLIEARDTQHNVVLTWREASNLLLELDRKNLLPPATGDERMARILSAVEEHAPYWSGSYRFTCTCGWSSPLRFDPADSWAERHAHVARAVADALGDQRQTAAAEHPPT